MASFNTSYAPDEEQDELKRLMASTALVPPIERPPPQAPVAAPAAAPEPQPDPQTVAAATDVVKNTIAATEQQTKTPASEWDALAGPSRRVDVPPPPNASGKNNWLMLAALAADMTLNKGRSAGQLIGAIAQPDDTAFENYSRKMQHEKDLAGIEATQRRGVTRDNPLAWLRYEQSQERLAAQLEEQKRKAQLEKDKFDPKSERSRMAREAVLRVYPDKAQAIDGLSEQQLDDSGLMREVYAQQREAYRDKDFYRQGREFDRREGTRQDNRIETIDYQEGKKIAGEEREGERKEEARQVFGYTRAPNAPPISTDEAEKIRKTAAAVAGLEDAIEELTKIEASITPAERAKGKLGYSSDQVAEANQWQQEIAGQLRVIANFGTPQAGELAITYARVPEVTSVDGWLNGASKYRALAKVMRKRVDSELKAQGYLRDGASGASGGGGTKQRTVVAPKDDAGGEPSVDEFFK